MEDIVKERVNSEYLNKRHEKIYEICYNEIRKFNKDIINVVISYIEEIMWRYMMGYSSFRYDIIAGKYIYLTISKRYVYDNLMASEYWLNITEGIGVTIFKNGARLYLNNIYPYNRIYRYGKIFGIINSQTKRRTDDVRNIMKNIKCRCVDYAYYTQIRKGRNIREKSKYDDIIKNNPNKYYFLSRGENNESFIELKDEEYSGIIRELKIMNEIIKDLI